MGQGKSKISENIELFDQNSDIINKKTSSKFKCIIIKDFFKLTNKLGKRVLIELNENNISMIRHEDPIIKINYHDIDDWKFNEYDFSWCLCFRKYIKLDQNSDSDSLELIEIDEDSNDKENLYRICCKFDNLNIVKNFEKSLFIKLGQYMIDEDLISLQEYKDWFFKYHK